MPDFAPFQGTRYDTDRLGTDLSAVVAPPYDVIDDDRLAHLRATHQHNAVHLTRPEDPDRYERAARRFRAWQEEGVLVTAAVPGLYLYRVDFADEDGRPRRMTGVVGALALGPPGEGDVLPHERTMPKPKGDRLDLLRATRANLEPIWGLSLTPGLSALLDPDGPAFAECTDTRGARHRIHELTDPGRVADIVAAVGASPVVIADGHHRYETSLHYRAERRTAGEGDGPHDRIMTLVVELADDQLAVQPIHRLVNGLPSPDALREMAAGAFEVVPVGANEPRVVAGVAAEMAARGALALVDAEGVALLVTTGDALDAARFESDLAPALAAAGAEVRYRHDRTMVAEQVRTGAADAAVLLRPVDVPTIRAVAERNERMPQKTTFFHPKPSTGLVFRSLESG